MSAAWNPGPLGMPRAPEELTRHSLNVGGRAITATVLRFSEDGAVRVRLSFGDEVVGVVLEAEHVSGLRLLLADVLGVLWTAARRRRAM